MAGSSCAVCARSFWAMWSVAEVRSNRLPCVVRTLRGRGRINEAVSVRDRSVVDVGIAVLYREDYRTDHNPYHVTLRLCWVFGTSIRAVGQGLSTDRVAL